MLHQLPRPSLSAPSGIRPCSKAMTHLHVLHPRSSSRLRVPYSSSPAPSRPHKAPTGAGQERSPFGSCLCRATLGASQPSQHLPIRSPRAGSARLRSASNPPQSSRNRPAAKVAAAPPVKEDAPPQSGAAPRWPGGQSAAATATLLGAAMLVAMAPEPAVAEELAEWGSPAFFVSVLGSFGCVAMGGLMSGLTLGLLSLNNMDLQLLIRAGSEEDRQNATKVQPLLENQHLLLVTLLLCNALAMEALPLFLDKVVNPVAAIAISVSLVLVFGEVVPQAVCSKYGLKVGAVAAPLVRGLMTVCYPIAFPISKALDATLGNDHLTLYRRNELTALVDMSEEEGILSKDENMVIDGAMSLSSKTVFEAMTPLEKVFMLSEDGVLDEETMATMMDQGHSRVPVHASGDRQKIQGMLLMKNLICYSPSDAAPLSSIPLRPLLTVNSSTLMYDVIDIFQDQRKAMALVTSDGAEVLGIITLEDVLEELIQEELYDESDCSSENRERTQKHMWAARLAGAQAKEQAGAETESARAQS